MIVAIGFVLFVTLALMCLFYVRINQYQIAIVALILANVSYNLHLLSFDAAFFSLMSLVVLNLSFGLGVVIHIYQDRQKKEA